MAEFQSTMSTVLHWLLDMLSDLVGLFLEYPFMGFIMLAGVIYLSLDGVLMALSGHGGNSSGSRVSLKKSTSPAFAKSRNGSPGKSGSGSVKFSSSDLGGVNGYSSATGGKMFLKDPNAGHLKPKKKKKKGDKKEEEKQKQAQQEAFSNGYLLGLQDSFGQQETTENRHDIDIEKDD